jgi:hypothetical protein
MTFRLRHLMLPFTLLVLSAFGCGTFAAGSEPVEKPVLRVVYFTPNDREPIPGYVERLDKVLEHIREFFRDGMAAAGYGEPTFDLDRKEDGSLRVFVVRGEHPTEKYGRQSGWIVQQECRKALAKEGVNLQLAPIFHCFNGVLQDIEANLLDLVKIGLNFGESFIEWKV